MILYSNYRSIMSTKSILMMVSTYYGVGGNTTVINKLCQNLQKMGYETAIGAFNFHQNPPIGIRKIKLQKRIDFIPKKLNNEFDIIHCHQTLAIYYSLFSNKPFIFHYHGASDTLQKINLKLAMKLCKRKISKIISVSKAGLKQLEEILGNIEAEIVYNGVETNFFKPDLPQNYKKGDPQLLFVGNLYHKKNVNFLINLIPNIIKEFPKIYFQIIGSGQEHESLNNLIKQKNLEKFVELTGRVSDEELRLRYASADIYISASTFEVHPVPVMEAMASSLPLVLSDISPHKEMIELSGAGKTFSLKNKEIVTIIKEILEKRKHFSSNARKFAIQYDWENVSRKISKIYESL